ncbi:hypothetical protein ATANTOWER_032457 [Ataeniobius toweri]|uniref:Uncharacterized protein n=1 Tax=Ataeniobius toweri TaxID=208326 RepID=A0ABU7B272_9TELE|nr:hypothetical protein [Ataeniobius toweri]
MIPGYRGLMNSAPVVKGPNHNIGTTMMSRSCTTKPTTFRPQRDLPRQAEQLLELRFTIPLVEPRKKLREPGAEAQAGSDKVNSFLMLSRITQQYFHT